mmetsp:Transcript_108246/g.311877  ORF Transcript_108246/g.311877 Transcript_108246/m.311877 type:complete len:218 (-) Transcript_108246:26-679(-)
MRPARRRAFEKGLARRRVDQAERLHHGRKRRNRGHRHGLGDQGFEGVGFTAGPADCDQGDSLQERQALGTDSVLRTRGALVPFRPRNRRRGRRLVLQRDGTGGPPAAQRRLHRGRQWLPGPRRTNDAGPEKRRRSGPHRPPGAEPHRRLRLQRDVVGWAGRRGNRAAPIGAPSALYFAGPCPPRPRARPASSTGTLLGALVEVWRAQAGIDRPPPFR